jgi:PPOX class probable F420-dependent enzyme
MGMTTSLELLAHTKYVSVTTYRKDGTPVATPVWVVGDGPEHLAIWTAADSWKVKRIRKNSAILITPCTMRGEALGEAVPGTAEILSPTEKARTTPLFKRKYGLLGRLTFLGSRLRRGENGTVGIRVTLTDGG